MRVSANHFPQSLTTQIGKLTDQQNRLQAQVGSGRRVTNASDDPVAMRRLLDLQAETTLQVTIAPKGYAGAVALSVTGLAPGATATFAPRGAGSSS